MYNRDGSLFIKLEFGFSNNGLSSIFCTELLKLLPTAAHSTQLLT